MKPTDRKKRLATALATLVLLPLGLPAQGLAQEAGERSYLDESVMPEGVIGERIKALIETFNSGDNRVLAGFLDTEVTERFRDFAPMSAHEQAFGQAFRQWGPVTFHGIRTYDPPRPDETIVIVRDSNFDQWRAFTLRFDSDQNHLISNLGLNDARTPTNVEAEEIRQEDVLPAIERLVTRSCEVDVFSGTVLVASGNEVLYSHACGEASKRFHVENRLDTKFNLGSMNKMFTSVAIMRLVEEGVIALDDPISKYVDESWLPPTITDNVTVHHLLSHTSGLGSYFNDTFMESSRMSFRALDDYKPLVASETLAFPPGERFSYSNTGMFLLGVVIESATGDDYFDHIREHIYAPAGMENSDSYDMDEPIENLAIGYDPDGDAAQGYRNNLYMHVIRGGPAGGGFSTVEDLFRFSLALRSGALVSEESLDTMWTTHSNADYGYGFSVEELPVGKVVGHGGGFPGLNSNLDLLLDRDMTVAVMSNYGGAATPIAAQINQILGSATDN